LTSHGIRITMNPQRSRIELYSAELFSRFGLLEKRFLLSNRFTKKL
jgi:hypothetical protein